MADLREHLQQALGPGYKLDRELIGGGMARVFVAEDMALNRHIVVKILPPERAIAVSVERFKREILFAARLQHPHIVPLLSAGEADGLPYFTMPFVKGESLRERLARSGELSVNDTVHILRDIAKALAYAHGEGVAHRDIKPDNVIISGGVAVVTDFGVAKAMNVAAAEVAGSDKGGLTSLGVALGTPAYMSPEQASADPQVDHRSDIYSFGCLAYELLAGSSPFAGRNPSQLLAAHVTDNPEPVQQRRPSVPPPLAALVMKCLEKRPGDRPQSAEELLTALDSVATPSGGTAPTGTRLPRARSSRAAMYAGAGIAAVAIIALVVSVLNRELAFEPYRLGRQIPIAVTASVEYQPAISPDGKLVAYVGGTPDGYRIFIRQTEGSRPLELSSDLPGNHFAPKWSPDGTRLVFEARTAGGTGAGYVVSAIGGAPRRVLTSSVGGILTPAWAPSGVEIAYADDRGIWVQRIDSGGPRLVIERNGIHSPAWSRDGARLAFVEGIVQSLDNASPSGIRVVPVRGGAIVRLSDGTSAESSPVWTPDGKSLLFVTTRGGTPDIYQQELRHDGHPIGSPHRVSAGLNAMNISLSADGSRLAYDAVRRQSAIWMARSGSSTAHAVQVTKETETIECLSLSYDGKWLAYDSNRGGNFDIYKLRLDGGEPIQLTTNLANEFCPAWSPDDREIAFHSSRGGPRNLFIVGAQGGVEQTVVADSLEKFEPSWSPDGRRLSYFGTDAAGDVGSIFTVSRESQREWSTPSRLAGAGGGIAAAPWSPRGDVLALGGSSITLISAATGDRRVLLDSAGVLGLASWPKWSRDGSTLYYALGRLSERSVNDRYPVVAIAILAIPRSGGLPRTVVAIDPSRPPFRGQFATDGRRFFFTAPNIEADVHVLELSAGATRRR